MRNRKLQILVFFVDSKLKFSTETYIFIKHHKNRNLLHFSIDSPIQCCPEKATFLMMVVTEKFSGKCNDFVLPRVI